MRKDHYHATAWSCSLFFSDHMRTFISSGICNYHHNIYCPVFRLVVNRTGIYWNWYKSTGSQSSMDVSWPVYDLVSAGMAVVCTGTVLQAYIQAGCSNIQKEKANWKESKTYSTKKLPAKTTERLAGTAKLYGAAMAIIDRYRRLYQKRPTISFYFLSCLIWSPDDQLYRWKLLFYSHPQPVMENVSGLSA